MKLNNINFGGKDYAVEFNQTPNYSHTSMKKIGMVTHATTSNNFKGSRSWLLSKQSQASALFIVGRNVGEIIQLGLPNQKLWHAGLVSGPSQNFNRFAKKTSTGKYTNPNLYLDGIEYSCGEDVDGSGKVERDEIELTEWQYHCGEVITRWHADVCGYELDKGLYVTHQDITSYKPDMNGILDEINFRLFKKDEVEVKEQTELQKELVKCEDTVIEQKSIIQALIELIVRMFNK